MEDQNGDLPFGCTALTPSIGAIQVFLYPAKFQTARQPSLSANYQRTSHASLIPNPKWHQTEQRQDQSDAVHPERGGIA
jgi:hypothetical protein